jgi:hypothetical protein
MTVHEHPAHADGTDEAEEAKARMYRHLRDHGPLTTAQKRELYDRLIPAGLDERGEPMYCVVDLADLVESLFPPPQPKEEP